MGMLHRFGRAETRPRRRRPATLLACVAMGLGGCVQVQAPERPIEINLNVNVRQEVLLRLEREAEEIIEQNPELFPQ